MNDLSSTLSKLSDNELMRCVIDAAENVDVHLVGGAIRDKILGFASPDLDLVVAGKGRSISERLAALLSGRLVRLGGDRFAAYRIVSGDLVLDIWDRQGKPLLKDLERRDFTINAIAFNLRNGKIHDPFSGLADLERRTIRMVTTTSFARDPLRVLRLARFALLLQGFSIDPHTRELARNSAGRIDTVALERTRDELAKVLTKATPRPALELLADLELFPRLWNRPALSRPAFSNLLQRLTRYQHVESEITTATSKPTDRMLCVHALIAATLSPATGNGSEPGWALLSRAQTRAVARLVAATAAAPTDPPRLFLGRWGHLWLEAVAVAAATTGVSIESLRCSLDQLYRLVEAEGNAVLEPKPLLDGREIQELLALPPGPVIGRLLKQLLEAQLRSEVATYDQAREFLLQTRSES